MAATKFFVSRGSPVIEFRSCLIFLLDRLGNIGSIACIQAMEV